MKNHLPIRRTVMLFVAVLACLSTVQANNSRINPDTVYTVDYEIPSYIIPAQTEANKRMLDKARNLRSGRNLLERLLSLNENTTAVLYDSSTDIVGGTHESYREYYNDIEVDGTRCVIHYNQDGEITSINGNFRTINNLNTTPAITEAAALQAALDDIGAEEYAWENTARRNSIFSTPYPQGTLVVYVNYDLIALAYRFEIVSVRPHQEYAIFIDAQSGKVLEKYVTSCQSIAPTTANTLHSGPRQITTDFYSGSYTLKDYSRGNGIITLNHSTSGDYYSSDNTWSTLSNYDRIAIDAHWGAEKTYDFYLNKFGRNSYNNNGAQITSYVNDISMGKNAMWSQAVHSIFYGVTSDTSFVDLDITAHEITHAVTGATSHLVGNGESGALNEAMSDVIAVCVENEEKPINGPLIWMMGEGIQMLGIRDLRYPQCKYYNGVGWGDTTNYYYLNDYGHVHANSGVFGYWFYLLATGGSGENEAGISYSVEGIGLDKAIAICYQMNAHLLGSNSKYQDACRCSYLAAEQLGYSSDVEQIRNAWVAVGLELPSDVSIYGAGALCDTRNYTHSAVPTPFTVSWQLAGEDTDSFSFTSLGDSCSVTPLVYHTNKSAVVQLSILYNGHVFKKINKKIYTHSSSLHVSGYQDDYDHLGEFYPSQIFSYDANNAANGYSSSQILINTECDITLTSSRFKGMDISFSGNNLLPSNIIHNDSCVSFHTMPYFPFPLLSPGRGGTKPLTTTEYDLAMNVTSEGGCYDFTLNFLVSNIHEHDNELSISVSGNTLYAQLLTANGESIGGGLYQDPTWYLYVIQAQTGQTVCSKTVTGTSTTVNLSGLASGIYVVRAVYDGNTYSNKFLR